MAEGMEAGICQCGYELWEWGDTRYPRARKTYACCECGEDIQIGETHEYVVAKFDGEFWYYRTCLTCARIRDDYCAPFGGLRETLWECLGCDYLGEDEEEESR